MHIKHDTAPAARQACSCCHLVQQHAWQPALQTLSFPPLERCQHTGIRLSTFAALLLHQPPLHHAHTSRSAVRRQKINNTACAQMKDEPKQHTQSCKPHTHSRTPATSSPHQLNPTNPHIPVANPSHCNCHHAASNNANHRIMAYQLASPTG